jgi:hypothetical protein
MPDTPRATRIDIYRLIVMTDKSECSIPELINLDLKTEDCPSNRLGKTLPTNLRTSIARTIDNFRRNFKSK